MADALEAVGEHMQQEAAQKLVRIEMHDLLRSAVGARAPWVASVGAGLGASPRTFRLPAGRARMPRVVARGPERAPGRGFRAPASMTRCRTEKPGPPCGLWSRILVLPLAHLALDARACQVDGRIHVLGRLPGLG